MSYGAKLEKATYINFLPYIGENYSKETPKILVLGHSHYANCDGSAEQMKTWDDDKNRTREVVTSDYLSEITESGTHPYAWVRCFRYMAATLTGEGYHKSDYIWNNLAFHEFYQKHVGITHNDRQFITPELTEISQKALFEVVEILQPKLVIAWGGELSGDDCLPDENYIPIKNVTYENETLLLGYYTQFPDTIFWFIRHPSIGYSYKKFHKKWLVVKENLFT